LGSAAFSDTVTKAMAEDSIRVEVALAGANHEGGVRNVAIAQARMLSRRFEVSIVSDACPEFGLDGLPCSPIQVRSFSWLRRFGHVPREYYRSRELARAAHAAGGVIVSHAHGITAALPAISARRSPQPNLLVVHGDIFTRPRGTYDPLLTAFYRRMAHLAYRIADRIVVPTNDMASRVAAAGAARERIRVIPYVLERLGVEGQGESYAITGVEPEPAEFLVLFVGRLAPEKSVGTLLEAAALLRHAERHLRVKVVGDGPEAGALSRDAERLGVDGIVEFLGWRPREDLARFYSQASCVCVPSLDDPFPTVILEAFSKGIPVIASRVSGIPEMVTHGRTGLLYTAGDARDLAENIKCLMDDIDSSRNMGVAASAWLKDTLSAERVAPVLCDLITEVMIDRVGGRHSR